RVLDDVPGLRCAQFVREFRKTLRKGARRPGFRVVHYSIQDDHAHFLVEAQGRVCLANGMKSLAARFARCVNRVFDRAGRVLADRFHHVVKRTPTEVRRALAYVLLNVRKHFWQRRRREPPVVLDGASSGLWFDGWKGRAPPPRYADPRRACEVATPATWLLSKGWRRIGLIDPAEVPGMAGRARHRPRRGGPWAVAA
ncbi:MAG: transposase, partial [Gammaproteobacteria bacterium]|nr:transposase [Gammaproteobacteria bacterium]